MVGLSGAFGMICLCLWLFKTFGESNNERSRMLGMLLTPAFHPYVLLSGIGLVVIAFARGCILWGQSRDPSFQPFADHHHDHGHHHHDHDHHHHRDHDCGPPEQAATAVAPAPAHVHGPACGHEHKPGEACDHSHDHAAPAATTAPTEAHHEHGHEHHHHDHDHGEADHDHGWAPWRYVVILVPIILYLLGLPSQTPSISDAGHERFIGDFTSIIYEALPFIVLGVLLAGLLEEFVPQQALASVVPSNHVPAIMVGALLGLVFPMCECGIIVVMKRLLRKGLPLSVCVAYMLAGPVINLVVIGSTYVAFASYNQEGKNDVLGGPYMVVGLRVGLAYIVAVVTAIIVHWQWESHGNNLIHPSVLRGLRQGGMENDNNTERTAGDRLNNITQTALNDFVDILAFLVLGAIMAAIGKLVIRESNVQDLIRDVPAIAIGIMMLIAVLICLCSEADAFVAANFPLFWPDGSKLGFLVLGPMLDLKLLMMFTRVFRARLITTIVAALVIQVFAYSMVAHYIFGKTHPPESPGTVVRPGLERTYLVTAGITIGPDPLQQLVPFGVAYRKSGKGEPISYKDFWEMATSESQREKWKDKLVEVRGQFEPIASNDQAFHLSRLQITCCYSDRTTLRSAAVVKESVAGLYPYGAWIKVTGHIAFREDRGSFKTMLIVDSKDDIIGPIPPDPDPYVPQ